LCFQRLVHRQGAQCIGNRRFGHASQRNDVTGNRFVNVLLAKAAERLDLCNPKLFDLLANA